MTYATAMRSLRRLTVYCAALAGVVTPCFAEQTEMDFALEEIAGAHGTINNDVLTEICKLGVPITQTPEDYRRLDGTPVEIAFEAQSLSKNDGELSGSFSARSGAFAEVVYVIVHLNGTDVPSALKRGDRVRVVGSLPEGGNDFRGNLRDNCFIEYNAKEIEMDGF